MGVDETTSTVVSLDKDLDMEEGLNNFKNVTDLKKQYPSIKVLLSVGGFADTSHQYLTVVSKIYVSNICIIFSAHKGVSTLCRAAECNTL